MSWISHLRLLLWQTNLPDCLSPCVLNECTDHKQRQKSFIHTYFLPCCQSRPIYSLWIFLKSINVVFSGVGFFVRGKTQHLVNFLFSFFFVIVKHLSHLIQGCGPVCWAALIILDKVHMRTQTAHPLWDQSALVVRANTCNFYTLPEWFVKYQNN